MAQSKNNLKNVQKKDKKTVDEVVHTPEVQDVLPVEELKVEELKVEELPENVTSTEVVDEVLPDVAVSDPQPDVDVILEPSRCSLETLEALDPILPCGDGLDVSNDKSEFVLEDLHPGYFQHVDHDDVLMSNPVVVVDTHSVRDCCGDCEYYDNDLLTDKFNRLVTVLLQELGAGMRGGPEGLAKSLRKAKLI